MRAALAVVFAVALSVRLLVPAGLMPVATADGLAIGLCGDMFADAAAVHGARHGEDGDKPAGESRSQPCTFTALASPALAGDPGTFPPAATASAAERALPPRQADAAERRAFLSPPVRGPPTLA